MALIFGCAAGAAIWPSAIAPVKNHSQMRVSFHRLFRLHFTPCAMALN
jgi:hypothetical protein